MYDIRFSSASERYLKKLKDKRLKKAYADAINKIRRDPYIGLQKRGDLSTIYGFDVRYAGTNYEIAYRIYEDQGKLVVVVLAGSRENFYEGLKRYVKNK